MVDPRAADGEADLRQQAVRRDRQAQLRPLPVALAGVRVRRRAHASHQVLPRDGGRRRGRRALLPLHRDARSHRMRSGGWWVRVGEHQGRQRRTGIASLYVFAVRRPRRRTRCAPRHGRGVRRRPATTARSRSTRPSSRRRPRLRRHDSLPGSTSTSGVRRRRVRAIDGARRLVAGRLRSTGTQGDAARQHAVLDTARPDRPRSADPAPCAPSTAPPVDDPAAAPRGDRRRLAGALARDQPAIRDREHVRHLRRQRRRVRRARCRPGDQRTLVVPPLARRLCRVRAGVGRRPRSSRRRSSRSS